MSREPEVPDGLRSFGIVLDADHLEMDDVTEMFIYAAARAQHSRKTAGTGERSVVVVCDRLVDSSVA